MDEMNGAVSLVFPGLAVNNAPFSEVICEALIAIAPTIHRDEFCSLSR